MNNLLSIAALSALLYVLASSLVIYFYPRKLVPIPRGLDAAEFKERVKLRNDTAELALKVTAAIGAVGAFLFGVVQFTNEERLKSSAQSATLLANVIAKLDTERTDGDQPLALAGAITTMGLLIKQTHNSEYPKVVADIVATYLRARGSLETCEGQNYKKQSYAPLVDIQAAAWVFGARDPGDVTRGKIYNLENSCLVGIDLNAGDWGLIAGFSGVKLAGSKMLRIDLTKADLVRADLRGIEAGDWHNEGWTSEIGNSLHQPPLQNVERRKFVAHFIDTNLTNALLQGAGLEGADFSGAVLTEADLTGANISRTSFRGAQNLTVDQLLRACVGNSAEPESRNLQQPILSNTLKEELLKQQPKGVPLCP